MKKTNNTKIAPLYPALREKKRYIVFEIISESKENNNAVSLQEVTAAIQKTLLCLLGTVQYAQAQVMFLQQFYKQQLYKKNKGIIRINNKFAHTLRASFCFIDEIEKTKVIIRSVLSTGIVAKAKKCLLQE